MTQRHAFVNQLCKKLKLRHATLKRDSRILNQFQKGSKRVEVK